MRQVRLIDFEFCPAEFVQSGGFFWLRLYESKFRQQPEDVRIGRLFIEGSLKKCNGLVDIAGQQLQLGQHDGGHRFARIFFESLFSKLPRLPTTIGLEECMGESGHRCGIVGLGVELLLEISDRPWSFRN